MLVLYSSVHVDAARDYVYSADKMSDLKIPMTICNVPDTSFVAPDLHFRLCFAAKTLWCQSAASVSDVLCDQVQILVDQNQDRYLVRILPQLVVQYPGNLQCSG